MNKKESFLEKLPCFSHNNIRKKGILGTGIVTFVATAAIIIIILLFFILYSVSVKEGIYSGDKIVGQGVNEEIGKYLGIFESELYSRIGVSKVGVFCEDKGVLNE